MGSEHYCLRWNNHQSNLLGVFSQLLRDESLVDVTLACSEGHSIRAHKVVLSACSSYFQSLFVDHPSRHPIVILKDVRFAELRTLVDFMYKGEVNVEYCQLSALLKTAESLKVKGLAEMTNLGPSGSGDYNKGSEPEQTEPTELVSKRAATEDGRQERADRLDRMDRMDRMDRLGDSRLEGGREQIQTPPTKICKSSPERPESADGDRSRSPVDECRPSDMSIHNNGNSVPCTTTSVGPQCNRIPSPIASEPLPGPSNLPPVQQVPLSLTKEADWGISEEKSTGESSSDYPRHPHDTEMDSRDSGSPRLYQCMYCGTAFPHQSKLTRHILSHSLETLKYREMQQQQHHPGLQLAEPLNLMESHFGPRAPLVPHDPPDPTDQPPTAMDLELSGDGGPGVVLCKFCGKSFPDVSSLIGHLPVHTGDRPFKCEFCGKAFKLRHHMKDHCRVHTGERPFRCSLCGKTFSRSTILKAHEKTHYPKYVRKFLSPSPLDTEEESPH